ncbi:MAG: LLM class flavin-dependent oxidoreductase [Pseudomonadota bacterium]|nr:LLM class flavin-dependent oxidoreductase [Pseudomonadota bacterium]
MDFGISFPTYIRSWHDAKMAEDYGFSHAWFYDSQMCYSDVYASMALCAYHTRTLTLGTFVSILGNRIAPVTAHSIATINELAPGRAILGVGTGFTGRNVMGMPPIPLKTMRAHVEIIRDLLAGKEVLYSEGPRERHIKFLHPDSGYINIKDPIPIHMASNGPKALKLVGEIADGWITIGLDLQHIAGGIKTIKGSAKAAGRDLSEVYCSNLTSGCVLRSGESITSPRVLRQIGPYAILLLHTNWDPVEMKVGPFAPPSVAPLAKRYFEEHIMKMKTPLDRRFQEMHLGHLVFVRPGEEAFITPELIKIATLTGSAGEIIDRVHELEEAGVSNIALNVCGTDAREMIREFGNEVIAKL